MFYDSDRRWLSNIQMDKSNFKENLSSFLIGEQDTFDGQVRNEQWSRMAIAMNSNHFNWKAQMPCNAHNYEFATWLKPSK